MDEIQDDDVFLNGTLSSPECGIVLGLNGTTTHVEEHYAKAVNYTLMVTAVSFLQVCLTAQPAVTGLGSLHILRVYKTVWARRYRQLCTARRGLLSARSIPAEALGSVLQWLKFRPYAGAAVDKANGSHCQSGSRLQGVPAHAGASGHHGRSPVPPASHHRCADANMCHKTKPPTLK